MRGAFVEDLTWPEAGARIAAGAVVIVPVGRRVAEALPVLVAPVVSFGYYPAFVRYPGSQHLRAETFIALLTDVLTASSDRARAGSRSSTPASRPRHRSASRSGTSTRRRV